MANCEECSAEGTVCKECLRGFGKDSTGECVACPANCKECGSDLTAPAGEVFCRECNRYHGCRTGTIGVGLQGGCGRNHCAHMQLAMGILGTGSLCMRSGNSRAGAEGEERDNFKGPAGKSHAHK